MPDTLESVIFDHTVLLRDDANDLTQLRNLITRLKGLGLRITVFSNDPKDINRELGARSLPPADLFLTRSDIGVNKGSHRWVEEAARRLGVGRHQFLYVGDDERDWRTASNSAIFYLHAGWVGPLPPGPPTFVAPRPQRVLMFVTHFLTRPPRWEFFLDVPDEGIHLRSLLNASARLASTEPRSWFSLQDVLTYERKIQVRNTPAQDLLILHALSSLLLEGLVPRNALFTVYPSSTPGQISPVLSAFLEPASKTFHGYFRNDLLIRAKPAPDTSILRYQKRGDEVTFLTQANTVHVNEERRSLVEGRTVLVFDDFTSSGKSLEWARQLLYGAGADRVVGLTVGKYGRKPLTEVYAPNGVDIAPFALGSYKHGDFRRRLYDMNRDPSSYDVLKMSFDRYAEGKALPP